MSDSHGQHRQHSTTATRGIRPFLLLSLSSLLLINSFPAVHAQTKDAISWTDLPNWSDYRACVQGCFALYCNIGCYDQMGSRMGCETNKCMCGTKELVEIGVGYARTCAQTSCGKTVTDGDIDAAEKIMRDYCSLKDYNYDDDTSDPTTSSSSQTSSPPAPTSDTNPDNTSPSTTEHQSPTGTDGDSETNEQSSQTSGTTTTTGDENNNGNNKNSGQSFGTPEIVGTAIGGASLLATVVGVFVAVKARSKKQKLKAEEAEAVQAQARGLLAQPPMHQYAGQGYMHHGVVQGPPGYGRGW